MTLGGNNSFSGGLQIRQNGSVTATATTVFGSGAIIMGDSGTQTNATITVNLASPGTIANDIIVGGTTSSTSYNPVTFNSSGAGAVTFSGKMLTYSSGASEVGLSALPSSGYGAVLMIFGGINTGNNTWSGTISNQPAFTTSLTRASPSAST
jgi:hypothetical protein